MRKLLYWFYLLFKENRKEITAKEFLSTPRTEQKIILDHHICYGINKPLCGQPLGKKGLSRNKSFTTCPECKRLIRKK